MGTPTDQNLEWWQASGATAGTLPLHPVPPPDWMNSDDEWLAAQEERVRKVLEIQPVKFIFDVRVEWLMTRGIARAINAYQFNLERLAKSFQAMGAEILGWEIAGELDRDIGWDLQQSALFGFAHMPIYEVICQCTKQATGGPIWTSGFGTWGMTWMGVDIRQSQAWDMTDVINLHAYEFQRTVEDDAEWLDQVLFSFTPEIEGEMDWQAHQRRCTATSLQPVKPVAVTEYGFPGILDGKGIFLVSQSAGPVQAYDLEEQARGIELGYAIWSKYDPVAVIWHRLEDLSTAEDTKWQPHCGLIGRDGKPKPSWYAFLEAVKKHCASSAAHTNP